LDESDGWYLTSSSTSCIDTGDDTAISEPYDLAGNTRKIDGDDDEVETVDMGAYEYQVE
jgi:hypothetical protein